MPKRFTPLATDPVKVFAFEMSQIDELKNKIVFGSLFRQVNLNPVLAPVSSTNFKEYLSAHRNHTKEIEL